MANKSARRHFFGVCRCSRNQIHSAVAFLINFLFRKHENSRRMRKFIQRLVYFPCLVFPSLPSRARALKKKLRGAFTDGGRFLDDVGETNARRSKCAPGSSDGTDYFYDVMSQARGCPGDEMPPSHRRCNESSSGKRESARFNPPRATDNDLSPRDRNISRRLLFRVVLTLLLTATIDDSAN